MSSVGVFERKKI